DVRLRRRGVGTVSGPARRAGVGGEGAAGEAEAAADGGVDVRGEWGGGSRRELRPVGETPPPCGAGKGWGAAPQVGASDISHAAPPPSPAPRPTRGRGNVGVSTPAAGRARVALIAARFK